MKVSDILEFAEILFGKVTLKNFANFFLIKSLPLRVSIIQLVFGIIYFEEEESHPKVFEKFLDFLLLVFSHQRTHFSTNQILIFMHSRYFFLSLNFA